MITKENIEWLDKQIAKMPDKVREEITKKDPVEARVFASVNCVFYTDCVNAISHLPDGKGEMSCHECDGVIKDGCFKDELHSSRFVNGGYFGSDAIKNPVRL